MPILVAETAMYPEDLLDDRPEDRLRRRWWAVHTKARQEKALARQLLRRAVPFYLPLVPKTNFIRGRRVRSYIPLFSGYLFLFGSDDERLSCLKTSRTSRMLMVEDQMSLQRDLRQIRRLIASDAPLTVERRLASGQRVRIKSGSMKGVEGIVVSRRHQTRLQVSVDFLQQGASVEIDDFMVEPI